MITVALPTWNNKEIIFLALEGLIRQKQSPNWELIVLECASQNEVGAEYFKSYWTKLQKTGCVRMKYMYSETRMPLNQKWLQLAKEASPESVTFCLQASDDYPHPERNLKAHEAIISGADWYDCRSYYQYHIALEKMIFYDNGQTTDQDVKEWKTGFNMAFRTEKIRNIDSTKYVRRGVDFWLLNQMQKVKRYVDQNVYSGISTTGMNTISDNRYQYFENPRYPFFETNKKPEDMKVPKTVLKQMYKLKDIAIIDKPKIDNDPVRVEFTKAINGRQVGHKTTIPAHAVPYFQIRNAIKLINNNQKQEEFELCT